MVKQIRFRDLENNVTLGGILVDNEYIICGCCGGRIYLEDMEEFEIMEIYDKWVSLSDEIIGNQKKNEFFSKNT